jgi:hypothetical protein
MMIFSAPFYLGCFLQLGASWMKRRARWLYERQKFAPKWVNSRYFPGSAFLI